jgi:type I restriction enzyme S subunit
MIKRVNITEAVEITNNRVRSFKGRRRYLATGDLAGNEIDRIVFVDYDTKPSRADLLVNEGEIIVARMQATNKVLLIDAKTKDLIVSTGFLVLSPKNGFNVGYLAHYFRSGIFQRQKNKYCSGATQRSINNGAFGKLCVPSYPLDEQNRITKILDCGEFLRQKRKQSLRLLDDFLCATFLYMFGDPMQNPNNLPQKKIGDLGEVITGNTPSRHKKEYYGDYIEWIKSDNINTPQFTLTKAEEYLSKEGAKVGRIAPKGSVLITCIAGTPDCIGNIAMVDRDVAFNQQINAFVPGEEISQAIFFVQVLFCKKLIQQASTNSMKGLVTKGRFSEIKIIVPSKEQQNRFEEIFNKVVILRLQQQKSALELDNHFNTLIQKVFGEVENV